MFFYSKKSRRKIVHHCSCRYCRSLNRRDKGVFDSLDEANAAGYRLCNCCAPIAKYIRGNSGRIYRYCFENGLTFYLHNGCILITAKHSKWKIITNGKKHSIFLYHKNTFDSGATSIVDGYHSQRVRRDTVMEYLEYIAAHEDFRHNHPLNFIREVTPVPPRKGTKRWKKEQKRLQQNEKHMRISNVLCLIEELSEMQ